MSFSLRRIDSLLRKSGISWLRGEAEYSTLLTFCSSVLSGSGGQTQLSVSGAGRQQLSLLQPLWQLPPLLLLPHGRGGRTQEQRPQEKTVRLFHISISQTTQTLISWILSKMSVLFFAVVTSCWSWWRRRGIMSETWAWWWRWGDALTAVLLLVHH